MIKSKHVIYYVFTYDKALNLKQNYYAKMAHELTDDFYYESFNDLFRNDKVITSRKIKTVLDVYQNTVKVSDSIFSIMTEHLTVNFNIDSAIIRYSNRFKVGILELKVINTHFDDMEFISKHIDKNSGFSKEDDFKGIYINGVEMVTPKLTTDDTNYNINKIFLTKSVTNLRLILGRKNYQVMSIVCDRLSAKVKNIYAPDDLEIYKIATSEFVTTIGPQSFDKYLTTIYDKWITLGSAYIINHVNMVQIVQQKNDTYVDVSYNRYSKIVTLCQFQKAIFTHFQTSSETQSKFHHFNEFINKYYFIEISHDTQSQVMYEMMQYQLNNYKYYDILKEESNNLNSQKTNNYILILTLIYTISAIASLFVLLV